MLLKIRITTILNPLPQLDGRVRILLFVKQGLCALLIDSSRYPIREHNIHLPQIKLNHYKCMNKDHSRLALSWVKGSAVYILLNQLKKTIRDLIVFRSLKILKGERSNFLETLFIYSKKETMCSWIELAYNYSGSCKHYYSKICWSSIDNNKNNWVYVYFLNPYRHTSRNLLIKLIVQLSVRTPEHNK